MTWPRLILKGGAEALLAWNAYHYTTTHSTDWECFATDKKQPNDSSGENMSAQFTQVITVGFLIALAGLINCGVEMGNKFLKSDLLRVINGVIDSLLAIVTFVWVVWASYVRL